jgi:uncharacterized integral membrane protein
MTMTTNPLRFRDSLLADRLIRVFAGGGAFLFAALTLSAVIRLIMAFYNGETPGTLPAVIALTTAAIAGLLFFLYRKHVRHAQQQRQ